MKEIVYAFKIFQLSFLLLINKIFSYSCLKSNIAKINPTISHKSNVLELSINILFFRCRIVIIK